MSLRIKYIDAPEGAREAAQFQGAGQPFSNMALLSSAAESVAYATLEPDGWPLDGSRSVMSDTVKTGFWSGTASDPVTALLDPAPVITMSFPEKYTATGLTIIFSPGTGEWCPEIGVTWYADGAKLRQEIAYPTEASWTVPATVENFDKVTIELIRTNIPGHYAKVQTIELGQVIWFGRDELVSVHLVNEVDPTLSDLTVDTMSVTVQDKQNRSLVPQEKQKMELYRNDQLMATQYIESSSREAQRYSFSCQSAIGLLEDDYLGGIYNAAPIEGVLDSLLGGFTYELHGSFAGMTLTGFLPICTRREALHQIVFAIGAVVTTQGDGRLRIVPLSSTISGTFKRAGVFQGASITTQANIARFEVVAHNYTASEEEETLLDAERISGTDVLVTFSDPHHSYVISGGTITGSGANWATISANGSVTLTGKKYLHSTTRYTRRNAQVNVSERNNLHSVEEATLIHNGNVNAVLDRLYQTAQLRRVLSQEAVITGQRAGDRVTAENPCGKGVIKGYITAMESNLTQNGHTAQVVIMGIEENPNMPLYYAGELFAGDKEVLY